MFLLTPQITRGLIAISFVVPSFALVQGGWLVQLPGCSGCQHHGKIVQRGGNNLYFSCPKLVSLTQEEQTWRITAALITVPKPAVTWISMVQGKPKDTAVATTCQGWFQAANPILSPMLHIRSPPSPARSHVSGPPCAPRTCTDLAPVPVAQHRRREQDSATSIPAGDLEKKPEKHQEHNAIGGIRTSLFLVAQNSI